MGQDAILEGYEVFVSDGKTAIGAVRHVSPKGRPEIVIYVENSGEYIVPLRSIQDVHSQKVILNPDKLEPALRKALGHAHDVEDDEDHREDEDDLED